MATAEQTMYLAVCDGCGELASTEDWGAQATPGAAVRFAIEHCDFKLQADERLLCWDCRITSGDLRISRLPEPSPIWILPLAAAAVGYAVKLVDDLVGLSLP